MLYYISSKLSPKQEIYFLLPSESNERGSTKRSAVVITNAEGMAQEIGNVKFVKCHASMAFDTDNQWILYG